MVPERSVVSKSAKSVFFESINDIDIYVEDTAYGTEKLYSILFSRVFSGEYCVSKVFPLGGRDSVRDQHKKHNKTGRPAIYVIDSDLFFLTGGNICSTEGLFVLPLYCIENVLCDGDAFVEILDEEDPENNFEYIKAQFDYPAWVKGQSSMLFDLFVEYGVSFKLNPSAQTVAYSVNELVSSHRGTICTDKLIQRLGEVRGATIAAAGEEMYAAEKDRIMMSHGLKDAELLKAVSGKNYLFPLLKMRAKSTVKTAVPDINLKMRLAKICDVSDLMESKTYIVT